MAFPPKIPEHSGWIVLDPKGPGDCIHVLPVNEMMLHYLDLRVRPCLCNGVIEDYAYGKMYAHKALVDVSPLNGSWSRH